MSKTLNLITEELNINATDEEIRNCLEKLVDDNFKSKLDMCMDEIDNYDDLQGFIKTVILRSYWLESDDYESYHINITEVYDVLVISIAYIEK